MYQDRPNVEVTEVTIEAVQKKIVGPDGVPVRIHLGDHDISRKVDRLLQVMRKDSSKTFLLRWRGGRVPSRAVISGHTISWTQHGVVYAVDESNMVGTYDRLTDCGGDGLDQLMLIFVITEQVQRRS